MERSVGGHPWRILFCGAERQCRSIREVDTSGPFAFDLVTFSENRLPLDILRRASDDDKPIEAVIATSSWISLNDPTIIRSILDAGEALCVIVQASRLDRWSDYILSDRLMAVPEDYSRSLQLAAALAQKCRAQRSYAQAQAELTSTHRAARLVSTEFKRQHHDQEQELNVTNELFETALNNMSQGLCMFDANAKLVVCNEQYLNMYGLSREVVAPGAALHDILLHRKEQGNFDADPDQYIIELRAAIIKNDTYSQLIHSGDERTISIVNRAMANGGWVATHEYITERTKAEAKIRHMARHDSLTGLRNRAAFQDEMEQALKRVRRGDTIAVLCVDLDHFKNVNDTLGHIVGDKLLCSVAERLSNLSRDTDTISRLGGDEFAILQMGIDKPEHSGSFAQRLITAINQPYELDGHHVVVSASVGIAIGPGDGTSTEQLLRNADMALYRAKSDGRSTFRYFEPEMDAQLQTRRLLELDLRNAIEKGEFELFYQPQVDAVTERVTGCEALLRWNHPTRGLVSPTDFIPLTEEIGLIVPLGEWVLQQACREAVTWPDSIRVAVNLSPAQFKSRALIQSVINALAQSGLEPGRLELEITESVLLHDNEATLATLHQLRSFGIKISMDDFGTGYSSLSYLRSFPFDKIKIDRSFIQEVSEKSDCAAIIKAVAGLGKGLGIATTAEGVETEEQLRHVREEGCTEIQGYLFGAPLPIHTLRACLARGGRRACAA